jgi:hypothetical protein
MQRSRVDLLKNLAAAFKINSEAKLAALSAGLPFTIPVILIREFSPEAMAIPEFVHHRMSPSLESFIRGCRSLVPQYPALPAASTCVRLTWGPTARTSKVIQTTYRCTRDEWLKHSTIGPGPMGPAEDGAQFGARRRLRLPPDDNKDVRFLA